MQAVPPSPQNVSPQTLALAREAFQMFRARCFWFVRRDLEITEAHLPLIIRGLRTHGGHAGFALAAQLCP